MGVDGEDGGCGRGGLGANGCISKALATNGVGVGAGPTAGAGRRICCFCWVGCEDGGGFGDVESPVCTVHTKEFPCSGTKASSGVERWRRMGRCGGGESGEPTDRRRRISDCCARLGFGLDGCKSNRVLYLWKNGGTLRRWWGVDGLRGCLALVGNGGSLALGDILFWSEDSRLSSISALASQSIRRGNVERPLSSIDAQAACHSAKPLLFPLLERYPVRHA